MVKTNTRLSNPAAHVVHQRREKPVSGVKAAAHPSGIYPDRNTQAGSVRLVIKKNDRSANRFDLKSSDHLVPRGDGVRKRYGTELKKGRVRVKEPMPTLHFAWLSPSPNFGRRFHSLDGDSGGVGASGV